MIRSCVCGYLCRRAVYGICNVYGYVYVIVCGVRMCVCVWYVSMAACVVECLCVAVYGV